MGTQPRTNLHEFPQVARNIRLARKINGHTQESLAHALGITLRAVAAWEGGESLPARGNLEALARELHQTPRWFYGVANESDDQVAA